MHLSLGEVLEEVALALFLLGMGMMFLWLALSSISMVGFLVALYVGAILLVASLTLSIAIIFGRQGTLSEELKYASRKIPWRVVLLLGLAGFLLILLDYAGFKLQHKNPIVRIAFYFGIIVGLAFLSYICSLVIYASFASLRRCQGMPAPEAIKE